MPTPAVGPRATVADIVVEQGATLHVRFRWLDDGVPQSLANYNARFGIGRRRGRPPVITVSSGVPDEIELEPLDSGGNRRVGVLDVTVSPAKTAQLTRNGYYDLLLINKTDPTDVVRLYEGSVALSLAVTPSTPIA